MRTDTMQPHVYRSLTLDVRPHEYKLKIVTTLCVCTFSILKSLCYFYLCIMYIVHCTAVLWFRFAVSVFRHNDVIVFVLGVAHVKWIWSCLCIVRSGCVLLFCMGFCWYSWWSQARYCYCSLLHDGAPTPTHTRRAVVFVFVDILTRRKKYKHRVSVTFEC